MTTTATKNVTIHHQCGVGPAEDAAEFRLPLTFFDMIWVHFHPIQRLLFYRHPCSAADFLETIVPYLKTSLSQTLTHYLPLAGNLIIPLNSGLPELRYLPGDWVSVTFAVADEKLDFNHLTGYHARDADDFYNFIPDFTEKSAESESGFNAIPVLAIQVTLLPQTGICVGISNHHAVGDASSIVRFIKAWSCVSKLGELDQNHHKLPFYDRSVIEDPSSRRATIFWEQMSFIKPGASHSTLPTNKVRATFVLQKKDIVQLKNLALARNPDSPHLTSFTVTAAYAWVCWVKSAAEAGEEVDEDEPEYNAFAVDARSRLNTPVPESYFGNCLGILVAGSTHGMLKGKDGFYVAVDLLGDHIRKMVNNKEEILREADDWLVKYGPILAKRIFGVSGSPRFDLYDVDFEWGRPNKYESVSIDKERSMSLTKSREFEGGLEIGLSLHRKQMDAFAAIFSKGLKV